MQLEQQSIDGQIVVTLKETRLDAAIADQFKSEMMELVQSGQRQLVLDLAAVDFIDSSGLGAVVSILKSVGKDGSLKLCRLQDSVMSIFKLTRMTQVFSIHTSTEAALAA